MYIYIYSYILSIADYTFILAIRFTKIHLWFITLYWDTINIQKLDYWNYCILINKLQLVQNATAQVLTKTGSMTIVAQFCQHSIDSQ